MAHRFMPLCCSDACLMPRPKLLLLDEPSHELGPNLVEEMHEGFKAIHASRTNPSGQAEWRAGTRPH